MLAGNCSGKIKQVNAFVVRKIKNISQKLASAILAVLLIVAGIGLNVYQHNCTHSGSSNFALQINGVSHTVLETEAECVCHPHIHTFQKCSHCGAVLAMIEDSGCCTTSVKSLVIKTSYIGSENQNIGVPSFPVLFAIFNEFQSLCEDYYQQNIISGETIKPPVLPSGRQLVTIYHQFRFDHPNLNA